MQIEHLEIFNFLSYEEATLNLKDRGLILVEGENRDQGGSNGAGKTSIFEAICWGMFGITNSGLRGDDVCRFGAKDTRVVLHLQVGKQQVVVCRHRKHSKHQNQLHFEIDGVDSRGSNDRETQQKLLQLLNIDWNTFISVALFPQGRQGIASWTDAEQKTVLDTILNLDRFRKGRERVMDMLSLDQVRKAKLELEARETNAAHQATMSSLEQLKTRQEEFERKKIQAIEECEKRAASLEGGDPGPADSLQKAVEKLRIELDQSRQEDVINIIQQTELKAQQLKMERQAAQTSFQMKHTQIVTPLDATEESKKHQDCPSCGQLLPEDARKQLCSTFLERAHEQQASNKRLQAEIRDLEFRMEGLDDQLLQLQTLIMESREKLVDVSGIDDALQEAERQIQEHHRKTSIWKQALDQARFAVEQQRAQQSPFTGLIDAERFRITTYEAKLKLQERELVPLREDIRHLEFWKNGFGNQGVKSLLMSTVTPFLNSAANIYMGDLSNDQGIIQIGTQKKLKSGEFRDKFSFEVAYPNAGNLYQGRSGGETRRADIAILFALGDLAASRAGAPVRLRLLDEPFEALDTLGCEQVIALLNKHIVPHTGTVLVMSHSDSMKALFERRIMVIKSQGISRIEDEG